MLSILLSCKGASDQFGALDATSVEEASAIPIIIAIDSYVPAIDPVNLGSSSTETFGITLLKTDTTINYTFLLDDSIALQSGTNPFYNLSGSSLTAGSHTLKVTAKNSISSDEHIFNIMVNSPTVITSFTPNLTGVSLACSITSSSISAAYDDVNASNTITPKWYVNNTLITGLGTSTAAPTNDSTGKIATLNFHPDCTQSGINFIRLDLNDGIEVTTQTWTFYVTSPITIAISDSTPSTNPTILTNANSATFGVTLSVADSTANFLIVLDNSITLQNDHRAYYNLLGSALTTGDHTLKITASNANSSAVKTFNIKKNAPATVTAFSPAYSGTVLNCGTTPITMFADMLDPNGDTLTYTWMIDDAPSAYIAASNTGNRAQATFTPNCSISGTRVIKAVVSDGYDSTTVTWSVNVVSAISVNITAYLPATNPTILISGQTTTFLIALSASDSNVTYNFSIKNLSTLVTTTLQNGAFSFYNLSSSSIAAGLYELTATASNGSSSANHVFTVRKNSPPAVPPVPLTFSPALTGTSLACDSASQLFQSFISDADGDIMAVNWYIDGAVAGNLVSASTSSEAKATYTPTCAEVGIKTVVVEVYDGHETTSKSWTVSIINPAIVNITGYSPTTDPSDILSTGAQTYTVSATGKAPIAYEWKLDGNVIAGSTGAFTTIAAASVTTGSHVLICKVSDSDSNQSHTFNIVKNAMPVLSNQLPLSQNPKINVNTILNLSTNFVDANNDTLSITWKLNNATVTGSNANASVTTIGNLTTLTLSPSTFLIGNNTIDLSISDGKESVTYQWIVNINYLSDVCNNLGSGKVCTILGMPGMGSGRNPTTSPSTTRIQPFYIEPYNATTSYFFSDINTHTVWFYNKSGATVSILGQSILAGKLQIVAGLGMSGIGTSGTYYDDFPLNNPYGLAWDDANGRLFISDTSNNRVIMLDSTGLVTVILTGTSNSTVGNNDGVASTVSLCNSPRGLAYNPSTHILYAACQGHGTVKYIDTTSSTVSSWTASILSGRASGGATGNASVDGTNFNAGTARLDQPSNLKLDTTNNILYVSTLGDCKLSAINLTGTAKTNYYFNAITLDANSTVRVIGSGCSGTVVGAYAGARFNNSGNPMGIELFLNAGVLKGIFLSEYARHVVYFVNNNTGGSITLGNAPISDNQIGIIWGVYNTAGYYMPCVSASISPCYTTNPNGLMINGSTLYIADQGNFRIRTLNIGTAASPVSNGAVSDEIGYDSKLGYSGNGGASAENVQFKQPMNLYYDSASNKLLISDYLNFRIRAFDLVTGKVDSFIGNGSGSANNSNADASVLGMTGPRAIINYQGNYVYADNQNGGGGGANQNCVLRAFNTSTTTQTILGVSIFANAVSTVAGNWANGCGAWNLTAVTGTHSTARLWNPQGLSTDGSNIYFTNSLGHCIIKVDSTGVMSVLSGQCSTQGNANAAGTAYGSALINYRFPSDVIVDPVAPYYSAGNLFILDQTAGTGPAVIRYLNQSGVDVTIWGVTVTAGQIKTVYTTPSLHGASMAAFDNQICVSSGGDYNYSSNGTSTNANNNVMCINRYNDGSLQLRMGRNSQSYIGRGAIQRNQEEEGIVPYTGITLAGPSGLAFDSAGNLYISERDSHVIRMVKKWW